jgi:hypothetical protein
MSKTENLGDFFSENKSLLKEYVDTKLEIVRLQTVRLASKSIGHLLWLMLSALLGLMVLFFSGLILGFWFSDLVHSYTIGFSLATLVLILLIAIVAIFRKPLFINPAIRKFIKMSSELMEETDDSRFKDYR